jgi:uncharacterized protein YndB with AHSA1/START domain
MNKVRFETVIEAPAEKVWNTMLAPDTYRQWTAEFDPGSYYEGSWQTGDRIRFLSSSGDGMSAVIAENRPHEFLSIKHVGLVKDGVEDTDSAEVRKWAPAFENYSLTQSESRTRLRVDMDVTAEFEEFMQRTWPKALARLKAICES